MTDQKREGLFSPYNPRPTIDEFMRQVDATGGWPLEYQFVGFAHTDKRECSFRNSSCNDGWWTFLYSSDDYHWWKISASRKEVIRQEHEYNFKRRIAAL